MDNRGYIEDTSDLQDRFGRNRDGLKKDGTIVETERTGMNLIRCFATHRTYVALFSFMGFALNMLTTYFVAVSTSFEKEFKLKSQITGTILSANEYSEVALVLILSYFGGRANRPKMLAGGALCATLSCVLAVVTHLSFGDVQGHTADNNSTVPDTDADQLCSSKSNVDGYSDSSIQQISLLPVVFLFFSKFVVGFANTLYYTIGLTYMDDGATRTETPFLLGLTSSIRLFGPSLAFAMASGLLKIHVTLDPNPGLQPSDPQWVGAWWIGFIVIGCIFPVLSGLLFLFPKTQLKNDVSQESKRVEKEQSVEEIFDIKGFMVALKRIFSNKTMILISARNLVGAFAFSGMFSFTTKFIEHRLHQSAASASLITGTTTVASAWLGFLGSGIIVSRWKPRASIQQIWCAILGFLYFGFFCYFSFMKCSTEPVFGTKVVDGRIEVPNGCSQSCSCESASFAPVCSNDGFTNFFSACHAGCTNVTVRDDGTKAYYGCSCATVSNYSAILEPDISNDGFAADDSSFFTGGYCKNECYNLFLVYVIVSVVFQFLASTTFVGNTLIMFRCVEKDDKSVALGMMNFLTSLIGFIPGPIVFGALIDKTCVLWQQSDSGKGNCWMYDQEKFQMILHLVPASCTLFGGVIDLVLGWYVKDLELYEKEDKK